MADTESSIAFGDDAKLDPWSVLVSNLIQDFDANELMFTEIRNLSKYQLGPMASCVKDGRQYFDILENNLSEDDLLEFLINLMDYSNFHQDLYFGGMRIADTLKEHSRELKAFKRKCMQKDIYDENFVGREEEIKTLMEVLTNETSKYRGLSICGLGGMGKTSLANEICRRLWASSRHWIVKKIDLRERKTMFNLLRDMLMKLLDQDDLMTAYRDTSEEDLKKQIFDKIMSEHYRMVLLLDNCDDVLEKDEENFLKFTRDLLQQISRQKSCKVRIIITSRQKLTWGRQQGAYKDIATDFQDLLKECEVKELNKEDAILLFKKCTKKDQASDNEIRHIVSLCHYIPLAIRTVCSTLKIEGSISPLNMIRLLDADKSSVLGIDHCLSPAFMRLDKNFQSALLQLCLFRTAEFDLKAAKSVLLDFDKDHQNIAEKEEIATLKTKFQLLHLKSRHLLEIHDLSIQYEDDESGIDTLYSIHPLVYDFLQRESSHQSDPGIQQDIEKAKERFAYHCNDLIDSIGDKVESGPIELNVILKNNRMLFMSFFDILGTVAKPDNGDPSKFYLQNRQLSVLSDLLMVDNNARTKRVELMKKWAKDAETEKIWENAIFWHAEKLLALNEMDEINGLKCIKNSFVTALEDEAKNDVQFEVLGRYYYAVARVYSNQNEKQQALHNLEKAVKWYERIQERGYCLTADIADVYNSIGCHSFESSDLTTARRYHEKALHLCEAHVQSNINPNVRVYLCNIGACLFNEGIQLDKQRGKGVENFHEALKYYTQAIDLDKQGNLDEKETHMEKLVNRAMVYVHLGEFKNGMKDVDEAEKIRRKILPAKHPKQTLTVAKKGEVMYRWALHMKDKDKDTYGGFQCLKEAEKYYCEAMGMIRQGGLDKDHTDYQTIRDNHVKVLKKLQDNEKLEQANDFYRRFESGEFDKEIERDIRRRQQKENVTKIQNNIQSHSDSSSDSGGDSSDDTDENIDEVMALTAGGQCLQGALHMVMVKDKNSSSPSTSSRPYDLSLRKENSCDEVFISPVEIKSPCQTVNTQNTNVQAKREEMRSDSLTSSSNRSSGSLSSQISVTDFQSRPSLMSSQSSSMEDIGNDQPKRKSSKKNLKRQNATSQFISSELRKHKIARRESWLSSSTESSQSVDDIHKSGPDVENTSERQSDQEVTSTETIGASDEMQSTSKRPVDDFTDSVGVHKKFKTENAHDAKEDEM